MRLLDGSTARLLVRGTGTSGQFKISKRTAAGAFTDLATSVAGAFNVLYSTLYLLDFIVNYSTTGRATFYVNGVPIIDTGAGVDVTTDGAATLSAGDVSCPFTDTSLQYWSEWLTRDGSTLGARVLTRPPVAAGNTQSWTPNTVGNINELVINDTTFISTTSNDQLSEWTVSTTPPPGNWLITSVVQEARLLVGGSGPLNFDWLVRTSDGTDHTVTGAAGTLIFANYSAVSWPLNPSTSAAWQFDELINSGVESRA